VDRKDGIKVLITEADLRDYPGMFIVGAEGDEPVLRGTFAAYPLEETQERDRTLRVTKRADYIADTHGTREFPWRVIIATDRDGSLVENDIVYRLAPPCEIADTSWIKPGKVSWDWWNAVNLFGVDFKAGSIRKRISITSILQPNTASNTSSSMRAVEYRRSDPARSHSEFDGIE
jgi:alpha-glucosidase